MGFCLLCQVPISGISLDIFLNIFKFFFLFRFVFFLAGKILPLRTVTEKHTNKETREHMNGGVCWKSGRSTFFSACHSCRWRCKSDDWAAGGAYDVHQKKLNAYQRNAMLNDNGLKRRGWNLLRAGGVSPGYSCPVSCGCGVVCSCPGKGPAARPCSGGALDLAVSLMSCGCCGPCEAARCGSFHPESSGCAAR